jgi:hypothetical protein
MARGFSIERCPICGEEGSTLSVILEDVSSFRCGTNDCEFTTDDIRKLVNGWQAVLAWVETAPALPIEDRP